MNEMKENPVIFLDTKEVAELIRSTPKTVWGLVQDDKIPFYRRGRKLLFKRTEIIKWVEEGQKDSAVTTNH